MNTKLRSFIASKLAAALWLIALTAGHCQGSVEAWVRRFGNSVDANDYAQKVVTDNVGNVIVAGNTDDAINGEDFLIIKYSAAGVPLWTNRYNGPGNGTDEAAAVAVDTSGNVFVTGSSYGGGSGNDYATIKYSGAGVPLWTNRYSGPASDDDGASALAVDSNGNAIVTGSSYNGTSDDYVTIKYSGTGVPLWTNRYNGPANDYDYASAVAVDAGGNVFVTGYSDNGASYYDYVTIKYSGAGVPLWTNLYSGPGNSDDEAYGIAVDASGNVFVTGYTYNGTSYDYATIKYSGAGVPLWTNVYDGPGNDDDEATAVAVDGSGNVLVTGFSMGSSGNYDFATIKYSSAGLPLWTNRYNGPGNDNDGARAVVVDGSGNVFVTGYSTGSGSFQDYATIKYSSTGVPLWTNRYDGPGSNYDSARAVAVSGSGNVCVTGFSYNGNSYDYATVAYSGSGVPLWTNRYNGLANGGDQATAVTVDGSGNVFVTGYSTGSGTSYDYATIKYSSAGAPLWTNRYNGPGYSSDQPIAIAVDSSGNVFVTGSSSHGGFYDFATVAYSGAGVPLWTNLFNGPGNGNDQASALAVDASGNVFVTGYSTGGSPDYATIKYSGAGVPLWTNLYNGPGAPGNSDDAATAVAVDGSGNVFVTGYSMGSSGNYDYATIKYSSAGLPLWTNRFNGPGNDHDQARAIAVDASGNVFVTGYSTGSGSAQDYATIKYSNAGAALWTNRYNGPGNSYDYASALALDSNGNVFVTGSSIGNGSSYDFATIKYSNAGVPLWTNLYNGPANDSDSACAVAVDGGGNVFVTGSSYNGNSYDYTTIAYSNAGAPLWTNHYNGPANGDDRPETPSSLAVGPDGSVYVTGSSDGNYTSGTAYDYATVKYSIGGPYLTIQPDGGNGYFLRFQGIAGTAYRLQRATSVTGPWISSAPQTAPLSGFVEFWDIFPPLGQAFYRVRAE